MEQVIQWVIIGVAVVVFGLICKSPYLQPNISVRSG